ncbi:acyl-CoA-binding domain-containing protein 5A-like isoform X2 [Gouania willdenowi]|uniref:acyl-CoA-binding domain-containing protein 5A-like isoform X2 n=1 Tax=Gouania willdenowi TaxID=441366 RepID=UPI0010562F5F|nr:acyl-CoA-binding domain-containing protein 5A-like isoform X2 [Gouania willdenowi]
MAQEADTHSLEEKFTAAVTVIQSLPEEGPFQPSDEMLLMFYGYYKQATVGPCNIPRPNGFWDTRDKAKWDAWSSLRNMSKEEAMRSYIEDIQLILEIIPVTEEVSDLLQKLGNFYSEVETEEEEEEAARKRESNRRPFTRPFAAAHADEQCKPCQKPTMEGFGGLWEDIQNLPEQNKAHSGSASSSVSSREGDSSRERSECERNEERGWRSEEEDITADGDEEEDRGWNQDWMLLIPNSLRRRSDTKGSSSSVGPNMSTFTNGTHSSLNSQVDEEELACSVELCSGCNPYMYCNGNFTDERDTLRGRKDRSADSDNDEFCDSMEDLAVEERLSVCKSQSAGSGAVSVRHTDLWFESNTIQTVGVDQVLIGEEISSSKLDSYLSRRVSGSQTPKASCSTLCCTSQNIDPIVAKKKHIDDQIATALLMLRQDMNNVLERLQNLELMTRSQLQSSPQGQKCPLTFIQKILRPPWWPFDVSPLTAVLTAFWPLIAFWLIELYHQRKRRKIPGSK